MQEWTYVVVGATSADKEKNHAPCGESIKPGTVSCTLQSLEMLSKPCHFTIYTSRPEHSINLASG
jgi:hypothetical protein